MFVGFGIFWNGASSIYRFLQGGSLQEPGILALVAALVSIVFKEVLYQYTVFKGRKLNSQAVVANAWHHRSDAFSSIGTAAGIGGAILLGDHWRVLDPVAAVIVSFFIMKVAVQLLIPCVDELLEKSLPVEVEDEILKTILSFPVSARRITFVRAASAVIVPSRCMCVWMVASRWRKLTRRQRRWRTS